MDAPRTQGAVPAPGCPSEPDANLAVLVELAASAHGVPVAWVFLPHLGRCWVGGEAPEGLFSRGQCEQLASVCSRGDREVFIADVAHDGAHDGANDVAPWSGAVRAAAAGLGFFAACPLRSLDDGCIGTLCIADVRPRRWSESSSHTMRLLGQLAASEVRALSRFSEAPARAEFRQAQEDLDVFVRAASHDLRGPLRTIMLLADAVQSRTVDDKTALHVSSIHDAAMRGRRLVDDLLTHTKADARKTSGRVDLSRCLAEARANLSEIITRTGARITSDALPSASGDATVWLLIIKNLLDNAIRYTPAGVRPEVYIKCTSFRGVRVSGTDQGNTTRFVDWLTLQFIDNGCGVDPVHERSIFEPLVRLHGSETPGSGLGLATVHKLVTQMGGRVAVTPGAGVGSVFTVEVPQPPDALA